MKHHHLRPFDESDLSGFTDPERLAERLQAWCVERQVSQVMASIYEYAGWNVITDTPIADHPTPLNAILVPMLSGGFHVLINPGRIGTGPDLDWLLAHEFAHTLFYAPGTPPVRIRPRTAAEEDFCDRFADAFTGAVAPRQGRVA